MAPDPGAIRAIVEQAEEMKVEPPRPLTSNAAGRCLSG
jgi:hypothetical protein